MGRAIITANLGEGLFLARLAYDLTDLEAELTRLQAQEDAYPALILKALITRVDLEKEKEEARVGLDRMVELWIDNLMDKFRDPPAIEPDDPIDPITGLPWEDADRAQDGPLFDAINTARTDAGKAVLTRDADLDAAILAQLQEMAWTRSTSHINANGSQVRQRVYASGYAFDDDIGLGELFAFGCNSAQKAVADWLRTGDKETLLSADYSHCGVGYLYRPTHPFFYLWGAVLAAPGVPPDAAAVVEDDPAKDKAQETNKALQKIEVPSVANFDEKKLGEAARLFALAAQKVAAAWREIERLMAERIARNQRITQLTNLKAATEQEIHIWSCQYDPLLIAGDYCTTAEIPGFLVDSPVPRETLMDSGQRVNYLERPINLIPPLAVKHQLQPGETMTGAAIFVNAALEPGHLRWHPCWRYGTITAMDPNGEDFCDLTLEAATCRHFNDEPDAFDLDAADQLNLVRVPIIYPPCNALVFDVGDEVLIQFETFDRTKPKVIGFRREPKECPAGRVSWRQLIRP